MPQDEIVPVPQRAFPYGVHIRSAGSQGHGPDQGVLGPALGLFLLYPAGTAYAQHGVTFHDNTSLSARDGLSR